MTNSTLASWFHLMIVNLNCICLFEHSLQEASVTGTAPTNDLMDIDDPPVLEPRGPTSLFSANRGMNPFSLLDPAFSRSLLDSRNIFDTTSEITGRAPFVSQPREVREIPIEVKDGGNDVAAPSGRGPRIEDVTDTIDAEEPQIRGTVIVEDEDDDIMPRNIGGNRNISRPSAPQFDDAPDYVNDIEEEMIRAAIEASKRDAELQTDQVGPFFLFYFIIFLMGVLFSFSILICDYISGSLLFLKSMLPEQFLFIAVIGLA